MSALPRDPVRARARALVRALEEIRDERPPEVTVGPTGGVELALLDGEEAGGWEEDRPTLVLRATYPSGHGEASAHVLERDAALWAEGGTLVRVALRGEGPAEPLPGEDEAAAWERVRSFFLELLPPALAVDDPDPTADDEAPTEG